MSTSPVRDLVADPEDRVESAARWLAYAELTKPGLTTLVLITTALGYLLAATGSLDWARFVTAVVGTALVGGGANGLNQWWRWTPMRV